MIQLRLKAVRLLTITALLVVAILTLLVLTTFLPRAHARQDKPTPVNQGWRVVPRIKSDDLKAELEKLNAAGFTVPKDAIHKDDEGFVVILNSDDTAKEEEDDDEGRK